MVDNIIHFVDGLMFVVFGVVALAQPRDEAESAFAGAVWLLAGFGITHGIHDWVATWLRDGLANSTVSWAVVGLLAVSFVFLFEFGRRLLVLSGDDRFRWALAWPPVAIGIAVAVAIGANPPGDALVLAEVAVRYLLGLVGGVVAFLGLYRYSRDGVDRPRGAVPGYLRLIGGSLLVFGVLSAVFGPATVLFPASVVSGADVRAVTGVPVQAFRAVAGAGAAVGTIGLLRTVTAGTVQQLKTFEQLVEHTGHAVFLTDTDGTIRFVNPAFEETTGYSADEVVGEDPSVFQSGVHDDAFYEDMWTTILAGEVWEGEITNERADGEEFHAEMTIAPVSGPNDDLEGFVAVYNDVTERKERERDLQLFRTLLDNSNDGIFVIDPNTGRLVDVNETASERLGYAQDELVGMQVQSVGSVFAESENWNNLVATVRDAGHLMVEGVHERADGTTFPVEVNVTRVELDREYLLAIARDITERKETEAALRRERDRAETYLEVAGSMMVMIDADGTVSYVNQRACEVLGYEADDLEGRDWFETCIPKRRREQIRDVFESVMAGTVEATETHENPVVTADGEQRVIEWQNTLLRDEDDNPSGTLSAGNDVTDRKRREERLQRYKEYLDEFYRTSTRSDLSFDEKVDAMLEAGCEFLGFDIGILSNIEGTDYHVRRVYDETETIDAGDVFPLEHTYCEIAASQSQPLGFADAIEAGRADHPCYREFGLVSYLGVRIEVDGALYGTLNFSSPEVRGDPLTETDRTFMTLLSQWVSYELDRLQSQRELQRQNDRLDQFASVVSHDLRNPLNVANLNLELAAEECDVDHLTTVDEALDRMDDIIDDALLFAREGQAVEETERVTLSTVAERSWGNCVTDGCDLTVEDDVEFSADPDRLSRLLENLFRNSVEHNPDGVSVTVGALDGDNFFVADDGTGIPPEDYNEVFASGYSTSEDGTGLGLAIVKEIAEAHDWTIALVESDGGGTRFEFRGV